MTIWKFPLKVADTQRVDVPAGARFLTVQSQQDQPCLWAVVDPAKPKEVRMIAIFGTGHPVPDDLIEVTRYIGTFQIHGGSLIFHAFEML